MKALAQSCLKPKSSRTRNRRLAGKQANVLDFQTLEDRRLLATLTVSSLNDAGPNSLREAITTANTTTEADTILFSVAGSINLDSQLPIIAEPLTIEGDKQITLDAGNGDDGFFGNGDGFRIFRISDSSSNLIDVTLRGLTLTGGDAANSAFGGTPGGAILSSENLTVTDSTIIGNSAGDGLTGIFGNGQGGFDGTRGGSGGGIFSSGVLRLINSTVSNNQSGTGGYGSDALDAAPLADGGYGGNGGGIYSSGPLTIQRSTISGNTTGAGGDGAQGTYGSAGGGIGGGIHSRSTLTIIDSTISGNETRGYYAHGGGVAAQGETTITFSTVTNNEVSVGMAYGGGIWNNDDTVTINNSIVAGNTAFSGSPDISPGTGLFDVDYSLIGTGVTPDAGGIGNVASDDPLLGPLADNGGPTLTHALLEGSPAIDAGDPNIIFNGNDFDQRGAPFVRVFDDPVVTTGNGIDIGAVERQTLNRLVDNRGDENDGDFSQFNLTLREAIFLANGNAGQDSISFNPLVFTGGSDNVIRLTQGELAISDGLTIDGTSVGGVVITGDAGNDDITLPGNQITDVSASFGGTAGAADDLLDDNSRVINFSSAGNLTLTSLTITGGRTTGESANGGGIFNTSSGAIELTNSTLSGNSLAGDFASGGGISSSSGDVSLINSTVSGNRSGRVGNGGGIFTSSGDVSLSSSTVSDNISVGGRGGGIITFSGTVSLLDSSVSGNSSDRSGGGIVTGSGSVTLTNSTVSGNSSSGTGGGIDTETADVALINSTLSNNSSSGSSGGGIYNSQGDVSLINSSVIGNTSNSLGGGIFADNVVLTGSTVSGNSSVGGGGGIINSSGGVTLISSTVSSNTSGTFGGGISSAGGSISLLNSTVSGNQSGTDGGGINAINSSVALINSTVTGNSTSGSGGGINMFDVFSAPPITIENSIVAGNFQDRTTSNAGTPNDLIPDPDSVLTINHSLIGVTDGHTITGGNNFTGTAAAPLDPMLGPLSDNGGPVLSHALLSGSPAIDAGDNALAVDANGIALATDQIGQPRLFDGNDDGTATVDIGAFEDQEVRTAGQYIFYNNSAFDGASNSDAIATDKVALRFGQRATFENYTSYIHGINGIAIDLFNPTNISTSDIQLLFGFDDDLDFWTPLDSDTTIIDLTTVAGAGVNGSDRVFIEFADGAITNGWLEVIVKGNAATGLTGSESFYFGNAIGESGNTPSDAIVNLADIGGVRTSQTGFGSTDVLNTFDFNRDARVSLADLGIARTNQSGFSPVRLITPSIFSIGPGGKTNPSSLHTADAGVALPVSTSTAEISPSKVSTQELSTFNFSSFAVATAIETATAEQAKSTEPNEVVQRSPLALVGSNLDTPNTQQNVLDQVFEATGKETDLARDVSLTDIDSLFETNFSADF